jgi:circadian clock protein KaiB
MNEVGDQNGPHPEGDGPPFKFELYMIGTTPSSSRAVVNVRKICEEYLRDLYQLKVIDVSLDRDVAKREQIIAAPTLIVRSPLPERRFIGDMSNSARFLANLGLG